VLRAVDRALAGETPVDPPEGMAAVIARRAAARLAMRRRLLIPRWLEGLTITGIGTATAIAGFAGCRVLAGASNGSLISGGMLGVVGLFLGAALVAFAALYYRA